jgi:hypothetical protein
VTSQSNYRIHGRVSVVSRCESGAMNPPSNRFARLGPPKFTKASFVAAVCLNVLDICIVWMICFQLDAEWKADSRSE